MCLHLGQTWLPQILQEYVEVSDAKISLITGWSSEIVKALYEGEAHVGIVRGQVDWKSRRTYLFREKLYQLTVKLNRLMN